MHQPLFQVPNQPPADMPEVLADIAINVDRSRLGTDPALVTVYGSRGSHKYRATPSDLRRFAADCERYASLIESAELVAKANLPEFN